jgi:hypothetical protein
MSPVLQDGIAREASEIAWAVGRAMDDPVVKMVAA